MKSAEVSAASAAEGAGQLDRESTTRTNRPGKTLRLFGGGKWCAPRLDGPKKKPLGNSHFLFATHPVEQGRPRRTLRRQGPEA